MSIYTSAGPLAPKLVRTEGTVVLSGGTVIDGTGAPPLADSTVVIRDGRITAVGSRTAVTAPAPKDVRTIDTTGTFLMPGLIDLHVHFTGEHIEVSIEDGQRRLRLPTPHRRHMEPIHSVRILRAAANASLVLATGVTTVRNLGHGDPTHVAAVQLAIRKGMITGPEILSAGWAISQSGGHGHVPIWPYELVEALRPKSSFADGLAGCAAHVEQNIREGADCIKIYATEGSIPTPDRLQGLPNFSVREIKAMTVAAHRHGLRVAAHATTVDGARNAVLGGVDTIEHGPHIVDQSLLKLMRRSSTVLVPTLSVFDYMSQSHPNHIYPKWVGERAARWLQDRFAVVRAAREAGVTVAGGSDSGPPPRGCNYAHELELLVQAGMTPLEAIGAATRGGAIAMGREQEIGTIRRGRRADILVLRKDPSADISILTDQDNILRIVQPISGSLL